MPTDDCCEPDTDAPSERSAAPARPLSRRLALSGLATLAGSAVAVAVTGSAAAQSATTASGDSTATTEPAPTTTAPPEAPDAGRHRAARVRPEPRVRRRRAVRPGDPGARRRTPPSSPRCSAATTRPTPSSSGGLLGREAPGVANQTLVDERTPAFGAKTERAIIRAAYELEISLAASYTKLLGQLKGTDAVAILASIQPIEARQAVVLGQAIDLAIEELMPVLEGDETGATIFTPAQYPIV